LGRIGCSLFRQGGLRLQSLEQLARDHGRDR
jgi:hypothetical protein